MKIQELDQNIFFRCVEDSSEAIMITDARGSLRYVNPKWCEVYGYTAEEAIGLTPSLLHSNKHNTEFYKEMWAQILDPAVAHWKGEIINRTKWGELVPVFLTITPYRDAVGHISGYMGLAIDITERKRIELALQEEDRLSTIGLLASGLAHEIGTPMTVIRGRAELLSMHIPKETNQTLALESGLRVIVEQIDRITGLIQSLLNLARSHGQIAIQSVQLLPIICSVTELLSVPLKRNNVTLKVSCDENLRALGDASKLTQVLLNLLVNALQALEDCSAEKRMRESTWKPEIAISARLDAANRRSRVVLRIVDNGPGIPTENLHKIFRPFYTTKEVGRGTGLGLAVVSKIVDELKGHIRVESTLGKGSEFTLELLQGACDPGSL